MCNKLTLWHYIISLWKVLCIWTRWKLATNSHLNAKYTQMCMSIWPIWSFFKNLSLVWVRLDACHENIKQTMVPTVYYNTITHILYIMFRLVKSLWCYAINYYGIRDNDLHLNIKSHFTFTRQTSKSQRNSRPNL